MWSEWGIRTADGAGVVKGGLRLRGLAGGWDNWRAGKALPVKGGQGVAGYPGRGRRVEMAAAIRSRAVISR